MLAASSKQFQIEYLNYRGIISDYVFNHCCLIRYLHENIVFLSKNVSMKCLDETQNVGDSLEISKCFRANIETNSVETC